LKEPRRTIRRDLAAKDFPVAPGEEKSVREVVFDYLCGGEPPAFMKAALDQIAGNGPEVGHLQAPPKSAGRAP
jgi:hypothetical protein